MAALSEIFRAAINGYAGNALNGYSYLTVDGTQTVPSIVSVGDYKGKRIVEMGLIARIVENTIIIEQDLNDKPLVDALVQAGISRKQIVLAYAGEPLPTSTPSTQ